MSAEARTSSALSIDARRMAGLHELSRLNGGQLDLPLFASNAESASPSVTAIVERNDFHTSQLACRFQSASRGSRLLAKVIGRGPPTLSSVSSFQLRSYEAN